MAKLSGFSLENSLAVTVYLEKIELKKIIAAVFNEMIFSSSELDEAKEQIRKLIVIPESEITKVINSTQQSDFIEFVAAVYQDKEIIKKFFSGLSKNYIKLLEDDVAYRLSRGMSRKDKLAAMIKIGAKLKELDINREFLSESFAAKSNLEDDKFREEFKNILFVNVEKKEFNRYLLKIKNVDVTFDREELEIMAMRALCAYFEDRDLEEIARILAVLMSNFETQEIVKVIGALTEIEKVEYYRFCLLYLNATVIKSIAEELNDFDKKNFSREYKNYKAEKETVKIKSGFSRVFNRFIFEVLESDNKTVMIKKLKELI